MVCIGEFLNLQWLHSLGNIILQAIPVWLTSDIIWRHMYHNQSTSKEFSPKRPSHWFENWLISFPIFILYWKIKRTFTHQSDPYSLCKLDATGRTRWLVLCAKLVMVNPCWFWYIQIWISLTNTICITMNSHIVISPVKGSVYMYSTERYAMIWLHQICFLRLPGKNAVAIGRCALSEEQA